MDHHIRLLAFVAGTWLCSLVAMSATAAEGEAPKEKDAPKPLFMSGEFVSFENGRLTLRQYLGRGEKRIHSYDVPTYAKTMFWNHDENRRDNVETAEAMRQLTALVEPVKNSRVETAETMRWRKAGTGLVVRASADTFTIEIGEQKAPFIGTFGSFVDDKLLFHFKNPDAQLRKSYGGSVRFAMNETIPVYESIDGGEYQHAGTPRNVLSRLKEGENITVYHYYKTETDEFYLVLVGMKAKQPK